MPFRIDRERMFPDVLFLFLLLHAEFFGFALYPVPELFAVVMIIYCYHIVHVHTASILLFFVIFLSLP